MDREEVKKIFEQALGVPQEMRVQFIEAVSAGREGLREEIESLLAAHEEAPEFFDSLARDVLPDPIKDLSGEKASSEPAETDELIGQQVSNYEILGKLGSGGMGVVYKARHVKLDRFAALKFLPSHLATDPDANARFIQEARAAYALEHKNICTIYDIGESEDQRPYIAMAFYAGNTLKELIKKGAMTQDEVLDYVSQITDGLQKAHERGVTHRDIKPANIFVTDEDVVKILDFGIAKGTSSVQMTQSGNTLGTISYMSPEQSRGESVSSATDIWSLGIVWYEMLTGIRPFEAAYPQAVIYNILNADPSAVSTLGVTAPDWVQIMINRCLSKDPTDRYQSAADLYADLYRNRRSTHSPTDSKQAVTATSESDSHETSGESGSAAGSATKATGSKSARKRVFVSYKRGIEPDDQVAAAIVEHFEKSHDVFIDTKMMVGSHWAERIETEIAGSDFVIALLSGQSVDSEMVQAELELASRLAQQNQGSPYILPIRLNFSSAFSYPLSAHLNHLNWAIWEDESDTPDLLSKLDEALKNQSLPVSDSPLVKESLPDDTGPIAKPLASAQPSDLESPEGTMDPQSALYIERDVDEVAMDTIRRNGVTMTIKGPRQMGKSSLLLRTIKEARNIGKEVVYIDFQLFDSAALEDADLFFRQFCAWISDELDIDDGTEKFWSRPLGNSQRATRYMGRHILKNMDSSLVLAMDEVERVFDTEFRSDFFSMLRSWHNDRAIDPKWKKLDLVLVTSTEPYQLIENLNQSPFNVGEVLSLTDFTASQVEQMNRQQGNVFSEAQLADVFEELAGHPYLTRKALYLVGSGRTTFDHLMSNAASDESPFGDHLRYHFFRLHRQARLVTAMRQVLDTGRLDDDTLYWRLRGAGLVTRNGPKVSARCKLYEDYMRGRLDA